MRLVFKQAVSSQTAYRVDASLRVHLVCPRDLSAWADVSIELYGSTVLNVADVQASTPEAVESARVWVSGSFGFLMHLLLEQAQLKARIAGNAA